MSTTTGFLILLLNFFISAFQWEGEICPVPFTDKKGKCLKVYECDYALELLKQNKNPGVCGFLEKIPLVCCPGLFNKEKPIQRGDLARRKCNEYIDKISSRAYTVGGEKALPKEFPHMVAIGLEDKKFLINWSCGGTLISHRFVLSAAHCVENRNFGNATWIRLGNLDLQSTTVDTHKIRITETHVFRDYKSSHYHDIALFKMERSIFFSPYIKPACLHLKKDLPVKTVEAIGWGHPLINGTRNSHLMKVTLSIVDHGACAQKYKKYVSRKLKMGILDEIQLCARGTKKMDTYPGDSGGPLHYIVKDQRFNSHFVVAGVTIFGENYGTQNPVGVYTRVSAYVDWIESIVWKDED